MWILGGPYAGKQKGCVARTDALARTCRCFKELGSRRRTTTRTPSIKTSETWRTVINLPRVTVAYKWVTIQKAERGRSSHP